MKEEAKTPEAPGQETGVPQDSSARKKNAKESLYDKVPLSVKQLDIIIIVLVIAFVVFLTLGILIGNRIIDGPKLF